MLYCLKHASIQREKFSGYQGSTFIDFGLTFTINTQDNLADQFFGIVSEWWRFSICFFGVCNVFDILLPKSKYTSSLNKK